MKCIICKETMNYYFSKKFTEFELENVDYYKCPNCGFCASKTHYEMDNKKWGKLNHDFHIMHNDNKSQYNSANRWFNQALMLHLMKQYGLIENGDSWLDYASGEGNLSIQLKENFELHLWNYDKYMNPAVNILHKEKLKDKFNVVVNGAYFEHVRDREHLDEVNSYVSENGCLAIHTLVREEVPKDPEWFYLIPVHTSFHTNKSMDLLIREWGYTCSVYNEHSQLWIMFKDSPEIIFDKVKKLNEIMGWDYLKYKVGFMDYWS